MTEALIVNTYLANLEPGRRKALAALRDEVRQVVPAPEESVRCGLPTQIHGNQLVCAFASQGQYMSLYSDVVPVEEHKPGLVGLNLAKSCHRFAGSRCCHSTRSGRSW